LLRRKAREGRIKRGRKFHFFKKLEAKSLALRGAFPMFDFMKRIFPLLLGVSLFAMPAVRGQDNRPVTLDPSDVEEIRRLIGRVADLEEMLQAQNLKIANMRNEIESLHRDQRESQDKNSRKLADAVTRDDLKKLVESIQEKRIEDNKQMLEAIEKMVRDLTKVAPPTLNSSGANTDKPDKQDKTTRPPRDLSREKPSTNTNNELVYTHTVAKGESLSLIISAYNAALKEQNKAPITLDMVRRANPKINMNNIYVGQEILIPVPPDKK
jgi:hypothetical protein